MSILFLIHSVFHLMHCFYICVSEMSQKDWNDLCLSCIRTRAYDCCHYPFIQIWNSWRSYLQWLFCIILLFVLFMFLSLISCTYLCTITPIRRSIYVQRMALPCNVPKLPIYLCCTPNSSHTALGCFLSVKNLKGCLAQQALESGSFLPHM